MTNRALFAAWSACGCGLLAATLAGCDSARARPSGVRVEGVTSAQSSVPRPRLTSRGEIEQVARRLVSGAGAKAQALELRISESRAELQVQNPQRPSQVVQLALQNGRVSEPVPIELKGGGELVANLFPLDSINLSALPELVRIAVERIDKNDGRVSSVLLRRNLPLSEDVVFRVFVDSPRRSGYLDADQSGKLLE